jgi:hypothetical protein
MSVYVIKTGLSEHLWRFFDAVMTAQAAAPYRTTKPMLLALAGLRGADRHQDSETMLSQPV